MGAPFSGLLSGYHHILWLPAVYPYRYRLLILSAETGRFVRLPGVSDTM